MEKNIVLKFEDFLNGCNDTTQLANFATTWNISLKKMHTTTHRP